jgi:hypothetical protein
MSVATQHCQLVCVMSDRPWWCCGACSDRVLLHVAAVCVCWLVRAAGDGKVDYEEFLAATMHLGKLEREENLYRAFQVCTRCCKQPQLEHCDDAMLIVFHHV